MAGRQLLFDQAMQGHAQGAAAVELDAGCGLREVGSQGVEQFQFGG